MKIPLIKLRDKDRRKTFVLTDLVPIFDVFEKNGSLALLDVFAKKDSPYTFAPGAIEFVDIRKILELYIQEEISWMHSSELEKDSQKLLALFDKIETKINGSRYEKSQQTIDQMLNAIEMDVDVTDSDIWENDLIDISEWDPITKFAYKLAQQLVDEERALNEVNSVINGYEHQKVLKEVCIIYYKYISKVYSLKDAKTQLLSVKKNFCH